MCHASLGSVLHGEIQEEKNIKDGMPELVGGSFSKSPSPGPEGTLAGAGGPPKPGGPSSRVLFCLPLVQLCSPQEWTMRSVDHFRIDSALPVARPEERALSSPGLLPSNGRMTLFPITCTPCLPPSMLVKNKGFAIRQIWV